ncbi:hypothetical protein [Cellulosimicrobium sp. SH8]|uniref:hypothetical protein n=1 Tax=Cellulosimicrobium sp. SH8 TaxID=2952936 RepID=UPI0021F37670|nr:hypothetical protein [Cellulosimicrobium sp. SH8]
MSSTAVEELLVAAGFWLDGFDRDRRRLVEAAVGALVAGLDSPALRELAGLYGYEAWSAVDALVLATASELGLPCPSTAAAVRVELDRRCREVLTGQTSARALAAWADAVDGPTRGDGRFFRTSERSWPSSGSTTSSTTSTTFPSSRTRR